MGEPLKILPPKNSRELMIESDNGSRNAVRCYRQAMRANQDPDKVTRSTELLTVNYVVQDSLEGVRIVRQVWWKSGWASTQWLFASIVVADLTDHQAADVIHDLIDSIRRAG